MIKNYNDFISESSSESVTLEKVMTLFGVEWGGEFKIEKISGERPRYCLMFPGVFLAPDEQKTSLTAAGEYLRFELSKDGKLIHFSETWVCKTMKEAESLVSKMNSSIENEVYCYVKKENSWDDYLCLTKHKQNFVPGWVVMYESLDKHLYKFMDFDDATGQNAYHFFTKIFGKTPHKVTFREWLTQDEKITLDKFSQEKRGLVANKKFTG